MVTCPHCYKDIDVPEIIDSKDIMFSITKEDVLLMADQMGIPRESITDDVLARVKVGMAWGLELSWTEVLGEAIAIVLREQQEEEL